MQLVPNDVADRASSDQPVRRIHLSRSKQRSHQMRSASDDLPQPQRLASIRCERMSRNHPTIITDSVHITIDERTGASVP